MAIEIEVLEKKKETVTFYTTKEIKNILKKNSKRKKWVCLLCNKCGFSRCF